MLTLDLQPQNSYMTDLPNIIRTKIIDDKWDIFWDDSLVSSLQNSETELLVITIPFSPGDTENTQLQKMMTACNLGREQYTVLQLENEQKVSWHHLREKLKPKFILLLGILPEQLGISAMFHRFAPNRFNDCLWIAAPTLSEMEAQPDAKRQLWTEGLKPVFVDKLYAAQQA